MPSTAYATTATQQRVPRPDDGAWTLADARSAYGVDGWGLGYFGINEAGHVTVHPTRRCQPSLDLKALVDRLRRDGWGPPFLLRFPDVLVDRVREVDAAFRSAASELGYAGPCRCVYPIKVNQQRSLVEELGQLTATHGVGLEAGSKAELHAVLPFGGEEGSPVVCNGFKDDAYLETVVLAQKLGKRVIPVVERLTELEGVIRIAEAHGVEPFLGVRTRLATRGAGRWEASAGLRGKFGLSVDELTEAVRYLHARGHADALRLLHCHVGSQIPDIGNIGEAMEELGRIYVELRRQCPSVDHLDVGGGLGIDYDGDGTASGWGVNYVLADYAATVVGRIKDACDAHGTAHPTLLSECGRAVAAPHSVLVFGIVDAEPPPTDAAVPVAAETSPGHPALQALAALAHESDPEDLVGCARRAAAAHRDALIAFNRGEIDLTRRAAADRLYTRICHQLLQAAGPTETLPEALAHLPAFGAQTYYGNFSVFQSLPDSWAIGHRFPIMPIHRLDERPTRRATLADMTCDSDGRVDAFVPASGGSAPKAALELHPLREEPYILGAFLVGAYQEILGDFHNLFGQTHAAHVRLGPDGQPRIAPLVPGDSISDVLGRVQFDPCELVHSFREQVEAARETGALSQEDATRLVGDYESGLRGYTYLD